MIYIYILLIVWIDGHSLACLKVQYINFPLFKYKEGTMCFVATGQGKELLPLGNRASAQEIVLTGSVKRPSALWNGIVFHQNNQFEIYVI